MASINITITHTQLTGESINKFYKLCCRNPPTGRALVPSLQAMQAVKAYITDTFVN